MSQTHYDALYEIFSEAGLDFDLMDEENIAVEDVFGNVIQFTFSTDGDLEEIIVEGDY